MTAGLRSVPDPEEAWKAWHGNDSEDVRLALGQALYGLGLDDFRSLVEQHEATLDPDTREASQRAEHLRLVNSFCRLGAYARKPSPDKVGLTAVRRLLTTPVLFELDGRLGTARISSKGLAEARRAKVAIADSTGEVLELSRPWPVVWSALLNAATETSVGALGTEKGVVGHWLSDFLAARPPVANLKAAEAPELTGHPYLEKDGRVVVFAVSLLNWLRVARSERLSDTQLSVLMRAYNAEADAVNVMREGRRTSTPVYRLPKAEPEEATPEQQGEAPSTSAYARRGQQ